MHVRFVGWGGVSHSDTPIVHVTRLMRFIVFVASITLISLLIRPFKVWTVRTLNGINGEQVEAHTVFRQAQGEWELRLHRAESIKTKNHQHVTIFGMLKADSKTWLMYYIFMILIK